MFRRTSDRRTAVRRIAIIAATQALLPTLTTPALADLRAKFINDAFSDGSFPLDDVGFTHESNFAFWRPLRGWRIGGEFLHRWITDNTGSLKREDQMELVAISGGDWQLPRWRFSLDARLGAVGTGNWGGRANQNGWHELTKSGPVIGQGLADTYVTKRAVGIVAGGRAIATYRSVDNCRGWLEGGLGADLQGSVITGVNWAAPFAHITAGLHLGRFQVAAHLEEAATTYAVTGGALDLPGGYGTKGLHREWRLGISIDWARFRVDYQFRNNHYGSGEPVGVVAFTIRQREQIKRDARK